jgi:hypothetical protein
MTTMMLVVAMAMVGQQPAKAESPDLAKARELALKYADSALRDKLLTPSVAKFGVKDVIKNVRWQTIDTVIPERLIYLSAALGNGSTKEPLPDGPTDFILVQGYVDTQNGFGAMIRKIWVVVYDASLNRLACLVEDTTGPVETSTDGPTQEIYWGGIIEPGKVQERRNKWVALVEAENEKRRQRFADEVASMEARVRVQSQPKKGEDIRNRKDASNTNANANANAKFGAGNFPTKVEQAKSLTETQKTALSRQKRRQRKASQLGADAN